MSAHAALSVSLLLAACAQEPPLSEADRTARAFLEAFATGDHEAAARFATGDVLHGVEVAKATRDREREEHPAEVALLAQAMRASPPDIELRPPRRHDGTAEVRAIVTAAGPRGPERQQYELWLTWQQQRWWVYRWQRR